MKSITKTTLAKWLKIRKVAIVVEYGSYHFDVMYRATGKIDTIKIV